MLYRTPTHPALAQWVAGIWSGRCAAGAGERLLPTGNAHVVWRLGAPIRWARGRDAGVERAGVVVGASDVAHDHDRPAARSVGVVLRPGAHAALLGAPAAAFARQHVGLGDLWGADVAGALHADLEADSDEAAALRVERVLVARIRPTNPRPIAVAMRALAAGASVAAAASAVGRTPRALGQWFDEAVGLSPRVWARIHRLQRVLRARSVEDLAQLAIDGGYADHSHLCREMRDIGGMTLSTWRAHRGASPNHVALPFRPSAGPRCADTQRTPDLESNLGDP